MACPSSNSFWRNLAARVGSRARRGQGIAVSIGMRVLNFGQLSHSNPGRLCRLWPAVGAGDPCGETSAGRDQHDGQSKRRGCFRECQPPDHLVGQRDDTRGHGCRGRCGGQRRRAERCRQFAAGLGKADRRKPCRRCDPRRARRVRSISRARATRSRTVPTGQSRAIAASW